MQKQKCSKAQSIQSSLVPDEGKARESEICPGERRRQIEQAPKCVEMIELVALPGWGWGPAVVGSRDSLGLVPCVASAHLGAVIRLHWVETEGLHLHAWVISPFLV